MAIARHGANVYAEGGKDQLQASGRLARSVPCGPGISCSPAAPPRLHWMGRAFSPGEGWNAVTWGAACALPQAGMGRAFGPVGGRRSSCRLAPCRLVALSPCRLVALSPCRLVVLSSCRLAPCRLVVLSSCCLPPSDHWSLVTWSLVTDHWSAGLTPRADSRAARRERRVAISCSMVVRQSATGMALEAGDSGVGLAPAGWLPEGSG